nr:MAG TPA: hypothetical protein [Caudoviricetes sp.]
MNYYNLFKIKRYFYFYGYFRTLPLQNVFRLYVVLIFLK